MFLLTYLLSLCEIISQVTTVSRERSFELIHNLPSHTDVAENSHQCKLGHAVFESRLEVCTGMATAGIQRNLQVSRGYVAGIPRGWM